MKNVFVLLFLMINIVAGAQIMYMTDETTTVHFVTKHLGGRLEGTFKGVQGSAKFDPKSLDNSYLKFSFATATATTNDPHLGPNLIQEGCFHPAKYPTIELFSTRILQADGENQYKFTGSLKVKGVTRYITFPFTATPNAGGYDFSFAFAFLRKAFKLDCGPMGRDFKILVRAYAKREVK